MKALAFVFALVAACNSQRPAEHRDDSSGEQTASSDERMASFGATPRTGERLLTSEPTLPSIYELQLELRDANGAQITLDVDRGHTTLVAMFYGSCISACPALIGELGQVMRQAATPQTRVLLVSFDPARDTPERLHELAVEHHLDNRWTLATPSSEEDARLLAAVLGVKFRKLDRGEFFHTSVVLALDGEGRPIARMNGLGAHDALLAALAADRLTN